MKILTSVFNKIISLCPSSPIEQGGILGEKNGIISYFYHDTSSNEYGIYTPDTEKLNLIINHWDKQNINFCGIYHSHYPTGEKLSPGDKEYIDTVLTALSDNYKKLYFPIVIPKKKIIFYETEKINNQLYIKKITVSKINCNGILPTEYKRKD